MCGAELDFWSHSHFGYESKRGADSEQEDDFPSLPGSGTLRIENRTG